MNRGQDEDGTSSSPGQHWRQASWSVPELANQARCHADTANSGLNEEVDSQRVGWPASTHVS